MLIEKCKMEEKMVQNEQRNFEQIPVMVKEV
jgi:hypothetical protein